MLVDPVTVTAAAPTPQLVLGVVRSDGYGSERRDTGGNGYTVITNHANLRGGGRKHYLQIKQNVTAPDPVTGVNKTYTASCSLTIVRPITGFTDAAIVALCKALTDYRDDSEVTTLRLLQFQS
ncbi:coat protein [ssRNA phage SRR6960549_5]|uniref:Coat protein n=1 Tax=ssRNA phage SRR6960549_5 TaxID=2786542 RepID=A0A8S5L4W9_9VIRU|nr:coat protein [ssRNA phage SRR6960549_5]DAD52587.1 TPA_asm: coat protein [ssRNA phage SRR6960549_5]